MPDGRSVEYEMPDPASPDYYRVEVQLPDPLPGRDCTYITGVVIECADVIDALGSSYNVGCALKYLWRLDRKGTPTDALTDLRKARAYLDREIARRGGK